MIRRLDNLEHGFEPYRPENVGGDGFIRSDISAWLVDEGLLVVQRDVPADDDACRQVAKVRGG